MIKSRAVFNQLRPAYRYFINNINEGQGHEACISSVQRTSSSWSEGPLHAEGQHLERTLRRPCLPAIQTSE